MNRYKMGRRVVARCMGAKIGFCVYGYTYTNAAQNGKIGALQPAKTNAARVTPLRGGAQQPFIAYNI